MYVDNLFYVFLHDHDYSDFVEHMETVFTYKQFTGDFHYLSLHMIQHDDYSISVDQTELASDILAAANMEYCKPTDTPVTVNDKDISVKDGDLLTELEHHRYRSLVGKLSYLCLTRFDLLFARQLELLSLFLQSPTTGKQHRRILHRVIAYIKGTLTRGMTFQPTHISSLFAYADADHANDPDSTRHSVTGIVLVVHGYERDLFASHPPANGITLFD